MCTLLLWRSRVGTVIQLYGHWHDTYFVNNLNGYWKWWRRSKKKRRENKINKKRKKKKKRDRDVHRWRRRSTRVWAECLRGSVRACVHACVRACVRGCVRGVSHNDDGRCGGSGTDFLRRLVISYYTLRRELDCTVKYDLYTEWQWCSTAKNNVYTPIIGRYLYDPVFRGIIHSPNDTIYSRDKEK